MKKLSISNEFQRRTGRFDKETRENIYEKAKEEFTAEIDEYREEIHISAGLFTEGFMNENELTWARGTGMILHKSSIRDLIELLKTMEDYTL